MGRSPGLSRRTDFRHVVRAGRRGRRGGLTVFIAQQPAARDNGAMSEVTSTRLGLGVRAPGRAVARNRVKRRLRAAFDEYAPAPGFDVLVTTDDSVLSMAYERLAEDLAGALGSAGLESVRR
ncbi:MAG: ribonuclease P protein component [Actinobacteria bacterium]|nr:ribonuclease P protein component [Actinomycetota bacterium]